MSVRLVGDVSLRLNQLAREELKNKLLADILTDMTICGLEGWDQLEYVHELHQMLGDIIERKINTP